MDKVFRVEQVTRIIVRGPQDFAHTVDDAEEGERLAELLNETYTWAFIAGKEYARAASLRSKEGSR